MLKERKRKKNAVAGTIFLFIAALASKGFVPDKNVPVLKIMYRWWRLLIVCCFWCDFFQRSFLVPNCCWIQNLFFYVLHIVFRILDTKKRWRTQFCWYSLAPSPSPGPTQTTSPSTSVWRWALRSPLITFKYTWTYLTSVAEPVWGSGTIYSFFISFPTVNFL